MKDFVPKLQILLIRQGEFIKLGYKRLRISFGQAQDYVQKSRQVAKMLDRLGKKNVEKALSLQCELAQEIAKIGNKHRSAFWKELVRMTNANLVGLQSIFPKKSEKS